MRRLLALLLLVLMPLPGLAGTMNDPEISDPQRDTLVEAPWADVTGVWFSTRGPAAAPTGISVSLRTAQTPDASPVPLEAVTSWSLGSRDGGCWAQLRIIGGGGTPWSGLVRHTCATSSAGPIPFLLGGAQPDPVYIAPVTLRRDGRSTHADISFSAFAGTPIASQYFAGQRLVEPAVVTRIAGQGMIAIDQAPNTCAPLASLWLCTNAFPIGSRPSDARTYTIGS